MKHQLQELVKQYAELKIRDSLPGHKMTNSVEKDNGKTPEYLAEKQQRLAFKLEDILSDPELAKTK